MPPIYMIAIVSGVLLAAGLTILAVTTWAPNANMGLLLIVTLAASAALRLARNRK